MTVQAVEITALQEYYRTVPGAVYCTEGYDFIYNSVFHYYSPASRGYPKRLGEHAVHPYLNRETLCRGES